MAEYRLRPRFRLLPLSAAGIGTSVAVVGVVQSAVALIAVGGTATALAAGYWFSPTWKMRIVTSPDELQFHKTRDRITKIAWRDIRRVFVDRVHHTCLVVGRNADSSLIVPGVGAPAPYDIDDKRALFDEIVANVATEKLRDVDSIEAAIAAKLPWTDVGERT
jgi:hypothetical protein